MLYIYDESINKEYVFHTDAAGYNAARNTILVINAAGHALSDRGTDSLRKINQYFGTSY